jgi:hypothetical protein
MRRIIAVLALLTLSACNTVDVSTVVPSFWDDNQSRSIINTYQLAVNIDCKEVQSAQAQAIVKELQWFQLYSESKGFLQKDVLKLIEPMQTTAKEWSEREAPSEGYCKLKKQIMVTQSKTAASAVLGRF